MKECIERIRRSVVCAGVLCPLVMFAISIFLLVGVILSAQRAHCVGLSFGTAEPTAVTLPDLHNPSQLEEALSRGIYELSSEYDLKVTRGFSGKIELCILTRHFSRASSCLEIDTDPFPLTCEPDVRPDCLPSSICGHYFGVSLWFQPTLLSESKVVYSMVDIDSKERYETRLTNTTTTLSALWYDVLDCQKFIKLTIAVVVFGIIIIICCLGECVFCYYFCCRGHKQKSVSVKNPTVNYGPLLRQAQDEKLAMSNHEETEGNVPMQSSEHLEEGGNGEATSLGPSKLHQDGLSSVCHDVSSSEEEDMQTQHAGGLPSRESVRTAVSERGHRKHGCRIRFVPTNRPMVGYSTDSTSMPGAPTEASTNDASVEDSSEDIHSRLSSSSSASVMVQEEATRVDTPPLFAHLHPTTVYDHRPGVTTEPRQPPDGI